METVITTTGADVKRGLALMSAQAYDKMPAETIGKEALQNALDACDMGGQKRIEAGSIGDVFRIRDYGPGMSPAEVLTQYLRGFVSGKNGAETRGAFGLAKIALLAAPVRFQVRAVRDGVQTIVSGLRGQWLDYAQTDRISLDPVEGTHTLPGGLTMTIGPTTEPDGFTYWCEIPRAYGAECEALRALQAVRDPALVFASCDSAFGDDGKCGVDRRPDCAERAELLTVRREETVPGALIRMFYDASAPMKPACYVPISSNGLRQFTESVWGLDAALPADISFDVRPTVGTDNADYPYTLNRDALKGAAKLAILGWLKQMADEAKKVQSDKLREVAKGAVRLAGSHLRFLDMSGKLPPEIVKEIQQSAPLADYARAVAKAYAQATEELGGQYADLSFSGISFGADWLGVKCGNSVWFDPFTIHTHGDHPEVAAGTWLHELAHCDSSSEGEGHARAMTFLAGRVSEHVSNLKRALRRLFERQSGFAAWLESINERGAAYRDPSAVEALLKIMAK